MEIMRAIERTGDFQAKKLSPNYPTNKLSEKTTNKTKRAMMKLQKSKYQSRVIECHHLNMF